jgi:hypothetical protein
MCKECKQGGRFLLRSFSNDGMWEIRFEVVELMKRVKLLNYLEDMIASKCISLFLAEKSTLLSFHAQKDLIIRSSNNTMIKIVFSGRYNVIPFGSQSKRLQRSGPVFLQWVPSGVKWYSMLPPKKAVRLYFFFDIVKCAFLEWKHGRVSTSNIF